ATVGLDGAGRIALLVEHTREVERSACVTLVIGKAVRLFRTRQVTCCLEALAEFERTVSGDELHPGPRVGVRGRNLFCGADGHCGLVRLNRAWLGRRHLTRL